MKLSLSKDTTKNSPIPFIKPLNEIRFRRNCEHKPRVKFESWSKPLYFEA